jgi:two-component system sensor histidine kinase KdpD
VETLALAGHELRRPLTVIRGAATLLLEAPEQLPAATRNQLLSLIDRGVQGMSDLIEDLTLAARLQAGDLALSLQPVEVDEIVTEALAGASRLEPGFLPQAPPLRPGVCAEADRAQAARVLRLLLGGALQRAGPEAEVELAVELEPAGVSFLVLDRGPVLAEAEQEQLFEPFSRSPRAPVAGLGLYLARGLAHAMGGEVACGPRRGGGSAFSFTLSRRV